jgi:Glycosyl hydrolases family 43/Ricin-type beta-trefoil lectin domain-like/Secretion system C-terminal sorting domain
MNFQPKKMKKTNTYFVLPKWRILFCFLLSAFFYGKGFGQNSGNPILSGYQADPDVNYFDGKYYIYPTAEDGRRFHAFSSTDLTNWVDEGAIFDLVPDCSWADRDAWAPDMVYRNGTYYFYYTAEAKIGVATGTSPKGPFTDLGSPLIGTDPNVYDIIDPMIFIDSDNQAYIYYGGSNGAQMAIRKLNTNMISFIGSPILSTPPSYTEAPYMLKKDNVYYLMYSNGSWFNQTYNVRYSTSSSPTGPWTYGAEILTSDVYTGAGNGHQGPGHHAVIEFPDCNDYYIVYHRYNNTNYNQRYVCIDRMSISSNKTMPRILMTNTGVNARTVTGACQPFTATAPVLPTTNKIYTLTPKNDQDNRLHESGNVPNADARSLTADNSSRQRWKLIDDGGGFYQLEPQVEIGKRLDVGGAGSSAGTEVIVWNENGNNAQKWKLIDAGNGWFELEPKCAPGLRLDVAGARTGANENVFLWTQNGNDAQKWKFTEVTTNARMGVANALNPAEQNPQEHSLSISYPNPANEQINVRFLPASDEDVNLTMLNAEGKVVKMIFKGKVRTNKYQQHTLETKMLSPGQYIIFLDKPSGKIAQKVLISH